MRVVGLKKRSNLTLFTKNYIRKYQKYMSTQRLIQQNYFFAFEQYRYFGQSHQERICTKFYKNNRFYQLKLKSTPAPRFCDLNGAETGSDNEKFGITQMYILYCKQCKSNGMIVLNNMDNIRLIFVYPG